MDFKSINEIPIVPEPPTSKGNNKAIIGVLLNSPQYISDDIVSPVIHADKP
jgi:hypothetical protein